jgi:hypothetical protein
VKPAKSQPEKLFTGRDRVKRSPASNVAVFRGREDGHRMRQLRGKGVRRCNSGLRA